MMPRFKNIIILAGDIILLYGSLIIALLLRYGSHDLIPIAQTHIMPFSFIFIIWISIFFTSDLYQIRQLKSAASLLQKLATAIFINIFLSILVFYLFGQMFELTPKTNLLVFAAVFGILDFFFRLLAVNFAIARYAHTRILIIGGSPAIEETTAFLIRNPQLGYEVYRSAALEIRDFEALAKKIRDQKTEVLVFAPNFFDDPRAVLIMYRLLSEDVQIMESAGLYEAVLQKIPLAELDESWFIREMMSRRKLYDTIKRFTDIILSIFFGLLFSPLIITAALIIRFTSPGPVIYKQRRTGQKGKPFVLYKLRTMYDDSSGPLWTIANDNRVTAPGRILRLSHLDELPQLWNIFKGELSFIGPRAERVELSSMYADLPHYEMRHIIKPGLTGWAQVNCPASASMEEALEKLQYDIFYIKNRSLTFDLLIFLKTIRMFFITNS